jgi:uncharacterized membrane protein
LSDKKLVLAIFDTESAADSAVESLKQWGKADKKINVDTIGVLALDDNGHLKAHKVGRRSTRKGAAIGTVLAVITPIGLAAGVIAGGLAGALHRKGLGLNDEYRAMLADQLMDGKAAVGVLAESEDAEQVVDWMVKLGGKPEAHTVSNQALSELHKETAAEQHATPPAA